MGKVSTAERRAISRTATIVALLSSPILILWSLHHGRSLAFALVFALIGVAAFRGFIDLVLKRVMDKPDLFGDDEPKAREEDAMRRRRINFWSKKGRLAFIIASVITLAWLKRGGTWGSNAEWIWNGIGMLGDPAMLMQLIILPLFFIANFAIFFGPLLAMNIVQIKGYEPGDADWGVKMGDVRGQAEAKEEIRKVVTLWQSGDAFEKAGGKRERGVLFLGPPGVGKTYLAKAIATGFNSPIVMVPGTAFSNAFMGMEIVVVLWMARKARKLAQKWGSCLIFIDEIDTVGMRRAALGQGGRIQGMGPCHGCPLGCAECRKGGRIQRQIPGGMMGGMTGGMALNALLVKMDGIDAPPFFRKFLTNKINLYLDALYLIPRRVGDVPLRLPTAKPVKNDIFFAGATNVPLESLDPALTRAGRLGRHVYFRLPTKRDRIDVFDLYLGKVTHSDDLDTPLAREELARVTDGYSPASIEQVCSLALTYAHHSGREGFTREDILEAMVTLEAGTALGFGYERDEELRATAIHEAGHAVCSHLYMEGTESTRLSVRRRGSTGGHHQAVDTQERVFRFRNDLFAQLVWSLGSYAAELVFYGNTTQGVGGDLGGASYLAGTMVGRWGMAPMELKGLLEGSDRDIERIGKKLLAVGVPGDVQIPIDKRRDEALLLGQALVVAYNAIVLNKTGVEKIAIALERAGEIFGDDVTKLLDSVDLQKPEDKLDFLEIPSL